MEIKITATKNYSVVIKDDLTNLNNLVKPIKCDKVAIISDSNVDVLYGGVLNKFFADKQVYNFVFKAGEDSKCADTYLQILNFLAENNFKRNDLIVAFGGGVTGDLVGFVAGTYMRGINFIMVPTTLLSMVDSSVGGKTAINLSSGKNLVGVFYQPSLVYICLDFLKTLPEREILSGMGEVVKYAFIGGSLSYDDIKKGISKELIYKCVKIKSQIVSEDEKEKDIRKLLNLGHTFGHAIEQASDYNLSHGNSVLLGLNIALKVSKMYNNLTEENILKAKQIISLATNKLAISYDKEQIINLIKSDKKGQGDSVDFIVINNNLLAEIKKIKIEDLYKVI